MSIIVELVNSGIEGLHERDIFDLFLPEFDKPWVIHLEEFFIVVYEDPLVKKELPKKFADYLDGQEPAKVYLRAADCGPRLWTVEVLFDGQGRMYLDKGWEKFAIAHGVDFGWFVHFKYEGDDVLTVKVFDGTMCRRYYYSDDEDTDDESDDDVKPCIHPL
ncbi:hypothetical protein QYE76_054236 [Lolium multiflorum]|uniref:TF-B3 domain-containing protein n=1 Tax=Lolium multiflorum TaxID=4521 RepID=A0AAD8SY78_LOLMU|nr:hypothetical protein QYE76_054236 [Lolium multiflorum]